GRKGTAAIAKWVDAGAPQGDARDMPKPPQFTDGWQLGEPDLVVELPEVQIPAAMEKGGDYFPTPNIALPLTEDHWIRALEIRPSNRLVTHHSVIFSTSAGSVMGGGGLFDVLGVWAVGTAPPAHAPAGPRHDDDGDLSRRDARRNAAPRAAVRLQLAAVLLPEDDHPAAEGDAHRSRRALRQLEREQAQSGSEPARDVRRSVDG